MLRREHDIAGGRSVALYSDGVPYRDALSRTWSADDGQLVFVISPPRRRRAKYFTHQNVVSSMNFMGIKRNPCATDCFLHWRKE
ncbi:hypothetical protein SAMN06295998_103181 [Primorskyibacter flagellatus]|uniref:Uncharacterized protein n=1 Tax=Primorskyibacter flagellatus TaxID=1387277 RepID=A0A1W2APQ8_9RHOB|nr:hypothetical protein SAMN06295998_103181 [Primorskyibacter flagellatus]